MAPLQFGALGRDFRDRVLKQLSAPVQERVIGSFRLPAWCIAGFWVYAGVLEYLQNFSPGRDVGMADVAVSALGALCGAIAAGRLWRHLTNMLPP